MNWYALLVNCRKEASTAAKLENRGIECFVPRYRSVRKWSDRTKEIEQALFPGYLFCRFGYENRQSIVTTAGVIQVVGNGRGAVPIPDAEIEALQLAASSGVSSEPWPYLKAGELVRVNYGNLSGIQGILVNFKGNHRVVLSVTLLQRSLALEVDLNWLTPLAQSKKRAAVAVVQQTEEVPAGI